MTPLAFIVSLERVYLVAHRFLRGVIRPFVPNRMENVRPRENLDAIPRYKAIF